MLRIYFRNAFRSLLRFRSFSIINLLGLTLGFSAIMVMTVLLYQYLTANGQFEHKERMYYVKMRDPDGGTFTQTPYPFLNAALASCPDIEAGTHIQSFYWPWLKAGSKEFQDNTWFVDPGFFQVIVARLRRLHSGSELVQQLCRELFPVAVRRGYRAGQPSDGCVVAIEIRPQHPKIQALCGAL